MIINVSDSSLVLAFGARNGPNATEPNKGGGVRGTYLRHRLGNGR
ncbi:hypothetical protein B0G52_11241 [Cohnella sp. SGD-V74]|nr:hypothetical protein B0G52_11241 [Cohnella sp. SGD-V74]